jgi:hypothetical protein
MILTLTLVFLAVCLCRLAIRRKWRLPAACVLALLCLFARAGTADARGRGFAFATVRTGFGRPFVAVVPTNSYLGSSGYSTGFVQAVDPVTGRVFLVPAGTNYYGAAVGSSPATIVLDDGRRVLVLP